MLRGKDQPADHAERLAFAGLAHDQKRYAFAARLAAEALAADPKLADDLRAGHRYNAACSAALAAAGAGLDEPPLDAAAKTKLRGQALAWLKVDLALWTKQLDTGKPANRDAVRQTLLHWQKDPDLAGIRDKDGLAKLPADEQKEFTQLWSDVAALLKKAATPAEKEVKTRTVVLVSGR